MAYGGGKWAMGSGLAAALVLFAGEGRADNRDEVVSITMSPVHLLFPVLELQAEYKVINGLGVSVIGGYGSITASDIDFRVWELGTQIVWYPLRDFQSLQLGGEALWVNVSVEDVGATNASGKASGLGVGPFVGFKGIVGPGFTIFIQGGVSFLAVHAEASDDTGGSATADDSTVALLLNFNIGWSF